MPREAGITELVYDYHVDPTQTWTTVTVRGDRFVGVGNAKRNPRDPADPQIGLDHAAARALRDLADQIERNIEYP